MIWHLNNTTVRNPMRYLEALQAYDAYGFIEDLWESNDAEKKFYNLILDAGLIESKKRDVDWNGRKWRLGLSELGLITHKSQKKEKGNITKTGIELLKVSNEAELQDIYMRVIYNLETRKKNYDSIFRPVPLILKIIKFLRDAGHRDTINQKEFALIIQDYRPEFVAKDYFNEIVEFRKNVSLNKGNLQKFYDSSFKKVFKRNGNTPSIKTISKEYPDVTFRLLKLSGLFRVEGSKLILNSQYDKLLDVLSADEKVSPSEESYYFKIANLPELPIDDNRDILESIVAENFDILKTPPLNIRKLKNEDLRYLRIDQEDKIRKVKEEEFALDQRNSVKVIAKWIECLSANKSKDEFIEGEFISFESDERPQYLEWIIWRAFLAINNLINKPYESRKFSLDRDLKPTNHAPSRGPDLLMEFYNFNLVVEVTWSTSSRQVAMEGEPVTRHVAKITYESDKPTYCLFIAPKIDINTYQYYKVHDVYFLDENIEQVTNIIPVSLEEFYKFFNKIPKANDESINKIYSILEDCTLIKKDLGPTEWKKFIIKKFAA